MANRLTRKVTQFDPYRGMEQLAKQPGRAVKTMFGNPTGKIRNYDEWVAHLGKKMINKAGKGIAGLAGLAAYRADGGSEENFSDLSDEELFAMLVGVPESQDRPDATYDPSMSGIADPSLAMTDEEAREYYASQLPVDTPPDPDPDPDPTPDPGSLMAAINAYGGDQSRGRFGLRPIC